MYDLYKTRILKAQYLAGCQTPPQKINPHLHREPPPQNFIGNPHLSSETGRFAAKHSNMNHIQMDEAISKKYLFLFHSQTNELVLSNNELSECQENSTNIKVTAKENSTPT